MLRQHHLPPKHHLKRCYPIGMCGTQTSIMASAHPSHVPHQQPQCSTNLTEFCYIVRLTRPIAGEAQMYEFFEFEEGRIYVLNDLTFNISTLVSMQLFRHTKTTNNLVRQTFSYSYCFHVRYWVGFRVHLVK